jgi:hypothetical protein
MNSLEVVTQALPTLNIFLMRQRQALVQMYLEKEIAIPEKKVPQMVLRGDTATLDLLFRPESEDFIPYHIDESNTEIWLHPQHLVNEVDAHRQRKNKDEATLSMALVTLNTIALGIRSNKTEREVTREEEKEVYQRTIELMELFREISRVEK